MVRGVQPVVARPAWHDRNPFVIMRGFSSVTGPHSMTDRWTYTVPAGKKAYIEFLCIKSIRATAAGTAGTVVIQITYTPSGASEQVLAATGLYTNTVGDKDEVTCGHALTMLAGDLLKGLTYDGSTGGTVNYLVVAKITEFDA